MKINKSLISLLLFNTAALLLYYFDVSHHFLGEVAQNALCFFPCLFNIFLMRKLILNKDEKNDL